jgi:hypothetical protein
VTAPVDPRVKVVESAIVDLWGDLDAVPTARLEAQVSVDAADRWDSGHGVRRVADHLVAELTAQRDSARAALLEAVESFERYRGPIYVGSPDDVRAPSIPVPTRQVEGWRLVAEGDE